MTVQNNSRRIARIVALVIVGIALVTAVTAGVSSVLVTLGVVLVGAALLVTLWLVLSLLDGGGHSTPARSPRIMALAIVGVALLAAGVSSVMTLWTSSFARFMVLEDLGLDGTTVGALAHVTPVDRGLLITGGFLALLGAAALIAAALAWHRSRAAE